METLISKFPPEPSYHKIPHLPVVLCSKISVREAQGSGLRHVYFHFSEPRSTRMELLAAISISWASFGEAQWPGHQSALLEPTQLRRHLAQPEVILYLSLRAIQSWAGPPLLKIRGCQSAYNEKGTWGREVFALSVKCKQMSSFWRPPCLIQQGHMRNHGWKETWVSCFLRCLTTTAAVWI